MADATFSTQDHVLEAGASILQDLGPIKHIHAHLNAWHASTTNTSRLVPTNHYCAHPLPWLRQCVLYDGTGADAKLIGVEYMITPEVYATLPEEERKLWHTHVFEVQSGMLVMPAGMIDQVPVAREAWEEAETREMKEVVRLFGKVYHLWQTDLGHQVPLGEPVLMTSLVDEAGCGSGFEDKLDERDKRLGTDWRRKKEIRRGIEAPKEVTDAPEGADAVWKRRRSI